jgi:hypothetical protein
MAKTSLHQPLWQTREHLSTIVRPLCPHIQADWSQLADCRQLLMRSSIPNPSTIWISSLSLYIVSEIVSHDHMDIEG